MLCQATAHLVFHFARLTLSSGSRLMTRSGSIGGRVTVLGFLGSRGRRFVNRFWVRLMADIIDLASRRKPAPATVHALAIACVEEIQANWEKMARGNRLNEFFISSTPSYSQPSINYLEDLNGLSNVELKIGLDPQVVAPGFSPDNALGWIGAFRLNGIVVVTPFLVNEQYARCFNILLFLKLKRSLVTNGILVTT